MTITTTTITTEFIGRTLGGSINNWAISSTVFPSSLDEPLGVPMVPYHSALLLYLHNRNKNVRSGIAMFIWQLSVVQSLLVLAGTVSVAFSRARVQSIMVQGHSSH